LPARKDETRGQYTKRQHTKRQHKKDNTTRRKQKMKMVCGRTRKKCKAKRLCRASQQKKVLKSQYTKKLKMKCTQD
jgi:hypothetical protein